MDEVCAVCETADWGVGSWGQDTEGTYVCALCQRKDSAADVAAWDQAGAGPCVHKDCTEVLVWTEDDVCPVHGLPSVLVWLGMR